MAKKILGNHQVQTDQKLKVGGKPIQLLLLKRVSHQNGAINKHLLIPTATDMDKPKNLWRKALK